MSDEKSSETTLAGAARPIRNIGVLTSGGDAPGMNAVIRAVVRGGIYYGYRVFGIRRGYHGLWRGEIEELNSRSVSETLQRGGTFLMTARSKTFQTAEGLQKAIEMTQVFDLDVIITIGGDGTFRGARDLAHLGVNVIGIPGTIDNDISCTEYTVGYDTAMNTAMEAIDRLRDTASSHERCSVIEVMGRNAGYLALNVAIAGGAEVVLIPEIKYDFQQDVIKVLLDGRNRGKRHYIVVVAEGTGDAMEIAQKVESITGIEARATILGHLQRGGSPTVRDRQMASMMGLKAIECIRDLRLNRLIAYREGQIVDIDIDEALAMTKTISAEDLERAKILAM
jgi:6-phosphofructokinase 1